MLNSNFYFTAAAATNIGNVRPNNEDNLYFNTTFLKAKDSVRSMCFCMDSFSSNQAFAVFDGMGGECSGERASEIAANVFCTKFKHIAKIQTEIGLQKQIDAFYFDANKRVRQLSHKLHATSGTTAVTLIIMNSKIYISNVGDSKAYRFRGNKLEQLSEDHNMAELMVRTGAMSREEANKSKGRHSLTRFIGANEKEYDISPFLYPSFDPIPGDQYLLCSDGLSDMVSEQEVVDVLSNNEIQCDDKVSRLIELALKNGGKDNCTVILVKVFSSMY